MKNKGNDLDNDGDENDDDDDDDVDKDGDDGDGDKVDDDGDDEKDDDDGDDKNDDLCTGRHQPWWPPSMILMMVMTMTTMTTMTTMVTKTTMMMMVMRTRTFAKGGINRGGRHQRHRRCQDGRTFHRVHRQLPKTYLYILIHHQHDYSLGK